MKNDVHKGIQSIRTVWDSDEIQSYICLNQDPTGIEVGRVGWWFEMGSHTTMHMSNGWARGTSLFDWLEEYEVGARVGLGFAMEGHDPVAAIAHRHSRQDVDLRI